MDTSSANPADIGELREAGRRCAPAATGAGAGISVTGRMPMVRTLPR